MLRLSLNGKETKNTIRFKEAEEICAKSRYCLCLKLFSQNGIDKEKAFDLLNLIVITLPFFGREWLL